MRKFIVIVFLMGLVKMAAAQPAISGPTCVMPGLTYQYVISGNWDSASTMSVCVMGGMIVTEKSTCTPAGPPVSTILIIWDSAAGSGSVSISSTLGSISRGVTITKPLQPGAIIASSKFQNIDSGSALPVIPCSAASGGSCQPSYQYQWQQSTDEVNWTDVKGATGQQFIFPGTIQQPGFFRRRVIETNSGAIAYSDVIRLFVNLTSASN